jgi:hypothetical protein
MSQRVVKSLNFSDADLGSLYDLEDVSADGALWLRATGLVEVPESARLLLSNHGGSSNLSALARFLPDDLWEIDLMYSDVRDEDLEHIAHLTGLRRLDLSMTRTTDAAIPYLEGLHGLEWLGLFNTKISRTGVGRLRQALPSCVLGGLPSLHLVRIPAGQERSQPGRYEGEECPQCGSPIWESEDIEYYASQKMLTLRSVGCEQRISIPYSSVRWVNREHQESAPSST